MSQDNEPTEEPPKRDATPEEIATDRRVQHMHRVFGRDDASRNDSQRAVVSMLEQVVDQQAFQMNPRTGEYDPLHAAQREGERNLARAILLDISAEPVSQVQKPEVKKQ